MGRTPPPPPPPFLPQKPTPYTYATHWVLFAPRRRDDDDEDGDEDGADGASADLLALLRAADVYETTEERVWGEGGNAVEHIVGTETGTFLYAMARFKFPTREPRTFLPGVYWAHTASVRDARAFCLTHGTPFECGTEEEEEEEDDDDGGGGDDKG